MSKYKEIRSLYRIEEIKDEGIIVQINKKLERVHIYEIEPLLFLDLSIDMQLNIINIYNQFLRQTDFKIQILVSNRKLNIDEYVNNYLENNYKIDDSVFNMYIKDIKEKLKIENIYETKYYIIFSENFKESSKKDEYEKVIYKLEEVGCKIKKINNIKEYEKILYKHLNKI